MHLIVPMGGMSSRYNLGKPKWLLTHPDGSYMIEKAIDCLFPAQFDSINLVVTDQVFNEFGIDDSLFERIFEDQYWIGRLRVHKLKNKSSSQLETVSRAIQEIELTGQVMIKDCDNAFVMTKHWRRQGVLTKHVWPSDDIRKLQSKCFASVTMDGTIAQLSEKKMTSNDFAVGGYIFDDATSIPLAYERLAYKSKRELYMSHAVNYLLSGGAVFQNSSVVAYEDWGTIQEWLQYCSTYLNLIVDIDGIIFENGSRVLYPRWGKQEPIKANVEALKGLQATGRKKIIFATARPEKWRDVTRVQLEALGLDCSAGILMGLFHAKRLLVNDFGGTTTPYPSAEAWSVLRNSTQLADIIAGQQKAFK